MTTDLMNLIQDLPVPDGPFEIDPSFWTPTQLTIFDDAPPSDLHEWLADGDQIIFMAEASPWWVGAWAEAGYKAFGPDVYNQWVDGRPDKAVIEQRRWVHNAISRKWRRRELSWSHHRAVAGIGNGNTVKSCLKWAVDNGAHGKPASVAMLTRHVQSITPKNVDPELPLQAPPKSHHTWTLSFTLGAAANEEGDAIHERLQQAARAFETEFAVEFTKFSPTKS